MNKRLIGEEDDEIKVIVAEPDQPTTKALNFSEKQSITQSVHRSSALLKTIPKDNSSNIISWEPTTATQIKENDRTNGTLPTSKQNTPKRYFGIDVKPGVSFWNILYLPLQNFVLFMIVENYVVLV